MTKRPGARELGAILNLPAERPRCANCGKPLAPVVLLEYSREVTPAKTFEGADGLSFTTVEGFRDVARRRRFLRWSAYGGLFHTLKCALEFATAAHAAGYRRKGLRK